MEGFLAQPVVAYVAFVGGADVIVAVVAIVASIALAVGFVPLRRAAQRLRGRQDEVGMAALVGRTVDVRFWDGAAGTVIIDGAFWSARGPRGLEPGDHVEVLYFEGMRLHVSHAIGKNHTHRGQTDGTAGFDPGRAVD